MVRIIKGGVVCLRTMINYFRLGIILPDLWFCDLLLLRSIIPSLSSIRILNLLIFLMIIVILIFRKRLHFLIVNISFIFFFLFFFFSFIIAKIILKYFRFSSWSCWYFFKFPFNIMILMHIEININRSDIRHTFYVGYSLDIFYVDFLHCNIHDFLLDLFRVFSN